jgi:hemerythrin superfamily protein
LPHRPAAIVRPHQGSIMATSSEFHDDDDPVYERATDSGPIDATELLKSDHDKVKQLFDEYESKAEENAPEEERQQLARQICNALSVHASIEEEIFYPVAREAIEETDLLDEASVEHAIAKDLIEQIENMQPSDELFDAKLRVLGEYVKHHIQEEEDQIFPQLTETDIDLEDLGQELAERRQELLADLGLEED